MVANKKRLIDIDEAIEDLCNETGWTDAEKAFLRMFLRSRPIVEASPVVHGHVLPAEQPKKVLLDMKCGTCDQLMLSTDAYCPMCGAKMDGEREEK